jgi:short-subunit dehydrogenase
MSLVTPENGTVLLTGASSGLGWAIARRLLRTNYRLILTARASSLPRFARAGVRESDRVHLRPLDVTDSRQRAEIVEEANRSWGGVDVLINNAGVSYRAVVEHFSELDEVEEMAVNFQAPVELIRLVLPRMREKRNGRIINISSVGGMMAMPTMALYSASKFALEGATEALWYEVRPWGIRVSLIEPGFIHSDSFKNTRYTEESRHAVDDPANGYYAHYVYMGDFIAKLMNLSPASPDHVAERVYKTMRHPSPPLRVAGTLEAYVFSFMRRFLPRRVYHQCLYWGLPRIRAWGKAGRGQPQDAVRR